ncbi:MAG: hypothetical protein WCF18_05945 [Chthoniobacteraceae bacterium]
MNKATVSFSRRAPRRAGQQGHAFIVALMIIAVICSLSALAIYRTTGSARLNARASDFSEGERVADGMIEYAYGVWKKAIQNKDGELSPQNLTDLNLAAPAIANYTTTNDAEGPLAIRPADAYGAPTTTVQPFFQYLDDYPGWRGFVYNYLASVKLKATAGLSKDKYITGAKRTFEYIQVPLFQSMFFFEHDLEIYRPATMIVGGLVHTNSRMLASGSSDSNGAELTFTGNVSYANWAQPTDSAHPLATDPLHFLPGYTYTEPPVGGPAWAGITVSTAPGKMEQATFANGGVSSQLAKVQRFEPLGSKPASVLNAADTAADNTYYQNNDSYRELIEPPVTTSGQTDVPEIAKRRLYNKAGIILTIAGTAAAPTVTVTAQNGTSLTPAQLATLTAISGTGRVFTGRSTIYDQREGKNVDIANIDVSTLTPVLNAAAGFNGVLYVQDATPKVTGDTDPRTVRLTKGGVLPTAGLTIASQNPIYIQGDYNTGTTSSPTAVPANSTGNPNNTDSPVVAGYSRKPAAVIADAVMLLSNNWNDSNSSSGVSSRAASNTTYNTAIMAGFIPSGWDPDGSGSAAAYGYSGGANNYPRFLESWTGKTCTYYGSMVELFQSQIFTGKWDTGNIYAPPKRCWNYDTIFNSTPPPGSVDAITTSRGPWARL